MKVQRMGKSRGSEKVIIYPGSDDKKPEIGKEYVLDSGEVVLIDRVHQSSSTGLRAEGTIYGFANPED